MSHDVEQVTQYLQQRPPVLGYKEGPITLTHGPETMFAKELIQAGHTRRFVVAEAGGIGWEIREEQDSHIVRRVHYTDWHRVERALSAIRRRVSELEDAGWRSPVSVSQ